MFKRTLVSIWLLGMLAACDAVDSMTEGFAHTKAISEKLEQEMGTKALVGFNWRNGTLETVTVTFQGIPEGTEIRDITDKAKQVIAAEFKQTPRQIIIGFSIEP